MLKDITIGQFFPGNSIIHRIDPRVKILLTIFYVVILFLAENIFSYALVLAFSVFLIATSKISVKLILKGLKPLLFIIIFTTILNIFYTKGGALLLEFSVLGLNIVIYSQGVIMAMFMITRIVLLILTTSLLTYTTTPILLTDGLERLMSPLKIIKVPVHDFAMIMTIALRFIPTLIEETDKIISAQKSRGADFESGNILKRAKALIPILIPLFVSAFRRADELAVAMECRCYQGGVGRTRLKQYNMGLVDYMSAGVVTILFAAVLVLNRFNVIGI